MAIPANPAARKANGRKVALYLWTLAGLTIFVAMAFHRSDYRIRGAPISKASALLIFATAWLYLGLRLILRWRWAPAALFLVAVWLYLALRPYLAFPFGSW
ncbi:MAG: hypothetical protein ACE5HV_04195 [Acidobacteriota bacterium]